MPTLLIDDAALCADDPPWSSDEAQVAATELGLAGEVTDDAFSALMAEKDPALRGAAVRTRTCLVGRPGQPELATNTRGKRTSRS